MHEDHYLNVFSKILAHQLLYSSQNKVYVTLCLEGCVFLRPSALCTAYKTIRSVLPGLKTRGEAESF